MSNTVPYYEDFSEIKKKIWSMFDDAVTNRSSPFRIPVFVCGDQSDFDGRIVVLRKSDQSNNLIQFHSDIRSCLLYTSPSPRDRQKSRMPSSA